eukprot:TRINITY_DN3135_c0_g2_i2.p1 TRINITY_DN3135_c0_g2~~TRINITY_DN3135_c0_g2_i2.p1  ORF type:complete len:233 (-),score=61.74 TRINITY_DN3135_c0_g2_i2:54-752(-)
MGNSMGNLFRSRKATKILMVGLDAAGKTTTLFRLRLGEIVTTIPTIGFNLETVQYKDISFQVWDVGGKDKIRPLWRHYYEDVTALIFVVDSNDRDRMSEAAQELHRMLAEDHLQGVPLLVFANKQDLPNACTPDEVSSALGLYERAVTDWSEAGRSAFLLGTRCEHSVVSLMRGNQHLLEEIWRHVGALVNTTDLRPHAPWRTFGSIAVKGVGLYEGLELSLIHISEPTRPY